MKTAGHGGGLELSSVRLDAKQRESTVRARAAKAILVCADTTGGGIAGLRILAGMTCN